MWFKPIFSSPVFGLMWEIFLNLHFYCSATLRNKRAEREPILPLRFHSIHRSDQNNNNQRDTPFKHFDVNKANHRKGLMFFQKKADENVNTLSSLEFHFWTLRPLASRRRIHSAFKGVPNFRNPLCMDRSKSVIAKH